MDDFYFENELKNRIRQDYYTSLQKEFQNSLDRIKKGAIENLKGRVYTLSSIVDIYIEDVYGENGSSHYDEEYEKFQDAFSEKNIIQFAENYVFSDEEITYIMLCISKNPFAGEKYITDVLLRAKMLDFFGKDCLARLIHQHPDLFQRYHVDINRYLQSISDKPFGEELSQKFEDAINNTTDYYFNQRINCGGYALKVDSCVFPHYKNFSQAVTRVLEEFPFTRLLGDTKLGDDEYLVIYRADNNGKEGHHFIRVDDDGVVREKDGAKPIQIFESWSQSLDTENTSEAIFAVKKEHQMFDLQNHFYDIRLYDFTERVEMAFTQRTNTFDYHGHKFQLKKKENNDIIIIDDKGNFIADVFEEDGKCLVDVAKDKQEYVENTNAKFKPIIKNGVLINYEIITGRKAVQKDDDIQR